jgi:hypothetical protein
VFIFAGAISVEDDYICLTAVSESGEAEAPFAARLSEFWTKMLREFPDEFEKVYAETIEFESKGNKQSRQYLCEEEVVSLVTEQMKLFGIDHEEVDLDDRWSKYEASPTEWWQIEH